MTGSPAAMARMQRQRNRFMLALGVFLVIAAGVSGYLLPQRAGYQQSAQDAQAAIVDLDVRTRDLMVQKEYAQLQREGFLGEQDRLTAARILDDLRSRHRISSLDYQIEPVSSVSIPRPQETGGLHLSESKISLNLRGFLDRDLNGFITGMIQDMPGHVTVKSVNITKLAAPDPRLLVRVGRGDDAALVAGAVELSTRTNLAARAMVLRVGTGTAGSSPTRRAPPPAP